MGRRRRHPAPATARHTPTAAEVAAEVIKALGTNAPTATPISPAAQQAFASGGMGFRGGLSAPLAPGGWADPLVAFGPGVPIRPAGIDPVEGTGRPLPRRFQYQVSWNLPGNGDRFVPWTVLRQLSEGVGVLRKCVEIRKSEMIQLDWDIVVATSVFEEAMLTEAVGPAAVARAKAAAAGDVEAQQAQASRNRLTKREIEADYRAQNAAEVARLKNWWLKPDRINDWTFEDWLNAVLEEFLVLDALTLYPHMDLKGDLHSLEVIDGSCYSDDTEVLTRRGWVKFAQIQEDDEFATRNPKTNAFEWQQATYFHQARHDGPMYHFTSRALDLLVTPNHRMLVTSKPRGVDAERRPSGEVIIDAETLAHANGDVPRIPVTTTWEAPDLREFIIPSAGPRSKEIRLSGDDFAALMGMYLAEGHTDSRGSRDGSYMGTVVISQDPHSKGFVEYRDLLGRVFGKEPYHTGRGFLIASKSLATYLHGFGNAWEKSVPTEVLDMSARQLEIFLHYYWLGDGWTGKNGQRCIVTASGAMAGAFQEIAVKVGMSASVHRRRGSKDRDRFDVAFRKAKSNKIMQTEVADYSGDVYCVSVPNEVLLVRRAGKTAWCGNTIKPLLDHRGATPQPPNPSYQQMLHGFPRGEFTFTPGSDGDYSRDVLLYKPRNRRSHSPYGYSPVEQAITDCDLYLKRRAWMSSEYDDGVAPELLVKVDSPMTAQQLRDYETVFNDLLSGNTPERHRARFLPSGFEPVLLPSLEERYRPDYDLHLIRLIGLALDVMPTELGFPPNGGLGGKGMNDGEENSQYRKSIRPTAAWLTSTINEVCTSWLDMPKGLTFQFLGLEAEDAKAAMDVMEAMASKGGITVNEMRDRQGLPRYDVPEADMPIIITSREVIPLEGAVQRAMSLPSISEADSLNSFSGQAPQHEFNAQQPAPTSGSPGGAHPAVRELPGEMPTTPVRAPNERSGDRPTDKPGAHPADKPRAAAKAAAPDAKAAGLAVWARDTGRVLLLQRALNPDDPAAGMWEFPGGCAEDGEDPLTAAQREWAEEVGQPVPAGTLAASWTAGRYVGHVWAIPTETDVTINADPDDRHVLNPDDPDGDEIEVVAWWDPGHLAGNPALRRELAASMPAVRGAFATAADGETAAKTAEAGQFRTFVAHLRKDERRFRPFQFDHHPGYIAQAANDLAAAGEYAAAMAVLDVVVAA